MKNKKLLIALIVLLIVGISLITYLNFQKWSCQIQGGKWGRIGIALDESCNFPTSDSGKECSDSDECEGDCLAELSNEERRKITYNDEIIYTMGKCARMQRMAGCMARVKEGKVDSIICDD